VAFWLAGIALAVILSFALSLVALRYRQKREKRSMRDHLHRISQASE
jgi:hypothetical protein